MTATTLSQPIDTGTLDARPMPGWYGDAKLGIFVHWGLYSIPAFAERTDGDFTTFMRDLTQMRDTRGAVPYAEWYLNALRIPGSATAAYHERTFGQGFSYFDLRRRFATAAADVDLDDWASFFADVGARYVVMVTRHLDGYPLWPTRVANPNMPADYRSERDLVGDLAAAVRGQGMKMGLYYAGGVDWTFTDHPIRTMIDLMADQALGPDYARYAEAQVRELAETYQPSILWNDMGWPEESDPNAVIAGYYGVVEDGLVNDRWTQAKVPGGRFARELYLDAIGAMLRLMAATGRSIPTPVPTFHYDIETHEYDAPSSPIAKTWELTRGLGRSFGYNAQETAADVMTGKDLVHLLVDVVSKGGNLLINVGPDGDGRIPDLQRRPLAELGVWLDGNGEAIFGTRPWSTFATTTGDGEAVQFTEKDGRVYLIVLAETLPDELVVRDLNPVPGSRLRFLGMPAQLEWTQAAADVRIVGGRRAPTLAHVIAIDPPDQPGA